MKVMFSKIAVVLSVLGMTGCSCCTGGGRSAGEIPGAELPRANLAWEVKNCDVPVYRFTNGTSSELKHPLLLLHELPGLSPRTIEYARELGKDFTVYVPVMFGKPYQESAFKGVCSYIFNTDWWPFTSERPLVKRFRGLVSEIARNHPGDQVRVIGMCMSGAFPLSLMADTNVIAAVCAQPTLPIVGDGASLDVPKNVLESVANRVRNRNAFLLASRFERDEIANRTKFVRLQQLMGTNLVSREITDYSDIDPTAHSTLTGEWSPGLPPSHPVRLLRTDVLEFLKDPAAFTKKENAIRSER